MSLQNIPWNKLTSWEKGWIEHTLESERIFNRPLPNNSFSKLVCFSIIRKANLR